MLLACCPAGLYGVSDAEISGFDKATPRASYVRCMFSRRALEASRAVVRDEQDPAVAVHAVLEWEC